MEQGRRRRRRTRGLTLVEVMISTIIIALIGVSLYTLLRTGIFTKKKVFSFSASIEEYSLDLEKIARDLNSAFCFSATNSGFGGEEHQVTFYTLSFDYKNNAAHPKRIRYSFQEGKLSREELAPLPMDEEEVVTSFVVADTLTNVAFSFYNPEGEEDQWTENWPLEKEEATKTELPQAIKIKWVFAKDEKEIVWEKFVFLFKDGFMPQEGGEP